MKPKILVSRKISDGAEEILKQEFDVTLNLNDKPYPYEELIKLANNYDGLISTSFDKLDKNFFGFSLIVITLFLLSIFATP